jgi:hypothetical protein
MSNGAKVNQLEEYLRGLILDELRKREIELKESDAQQIVQSVINEIDKLSSERIKQHFIEIAEFILTKFKKEKQ